MGTHISARPASRRRSGTTRVRPLGLLGLVALALLAPLLALLGSTPAAALVPTSPAGPATGLVAGPASPSALLRAVAPLPGDDFPRLPSRCYESDAVTVRNQPCRITRFGTGRPLLVAWGDSHVHMYLPALQRLARAGRVNLTIVTLGSCPVAWPLPASRGFGRSSCENRNLDTLEFLRRQDKRLGDDLAVLVGGFWSGYRDAYRRQQQADRTGRDSGLSTYQQHMSALAVEGAPPMFRRLGRTGIAIDLIGQAATVPIDARPCPVGQEPYQCGLPRERALEREGDNKRWITTQLRSPLAGQPRLVDATPAYCSATRCRPRVRGANTYFDSIHLGAELTRTLTSYFRPVFDDLR